MEVRELDSDVSFLRNYLTDELVEELDLYVYRRQGDQWVVVDKDWEKVRDTLVRGLTNFGQPYIAVEDSDYQDNGELLLRHAFEGQELDMQYAQRTLEQVFRLWGRPVCLTTQREAKVTVLRFDGHAHSAQERA